MKFILTAAIVGFGLTACSATPDDPDAADFVFVNAKVYTLDPDRPWAEAVAVRGDSIAYVGDGNGVQGYVGEATQRFDLGGQLLLPGFIDTHVHPVDLGGMATALSLSTESGGVETWLQEIADYAAAHPDKQVLFGYGFMASAFGAAGPTRQLIDAVVPDRPVLILDEGFHAAWANTAALERLNISQDTPDPVPGYSYYKRDANGDATGYLLEGAKDLAIEALDVSSAEHVTEGTVINIALMNSYGITSVFDAGVPGGSAEFVGGILSRLEASGDLTVRIVGSFRADTVEQAATAAAVTDEWRRTLRGRNYHYNTLKITDDGTIEARTAAMFENYRDESGDAGHAGATVFTEAELIDMMAAAAALNIDVHVHALGERAVHEALNAIEAVRRKQPDSESRYTLSHIQVIADQDVPRFAALDVTAQSTPVWATYDTYGRQFISEDQFQRYFRFKSIEDAGGRLAFGSDYPATGVGPMGLSPLLQIELGHTRQYPGDPDSPVQPRESERLGIASLVRGFTLDAAYQLHLEEQIGSIEVGKKADLVVLDQDIFTVDPYAIHQTNVVMTMLDGAIVYEGKP